MLLEALKQENQGRPPVWLMRQAGRYLPAYRKYREKHSLRDLFFTPELAAEITLMPLKEIGVDAMILFSDITIIAPALGLTLDFHEGPKVTGAVTAPQPEKLLPVTQAIQMVKERSRKPLIGFCGGPYTVSTYIPATLDQITDISVEYLKMQEKAGVDAIQIFDSWGQEVTDWEAYLPYLRRLVNAVSVPVIFFMRNAASRVAEIVSLKPSAISFDWEVPLKTLRPQVPMAIQGNLNPDILYESLDVIKMKTKALLDEMKGDPGFIVNLGHGLKPDMSQAAVKVLVDTVRES